MFRRFAIPLGILYLVTIAIYWLKIGGANTILLRNTVYLFLPFIAVLSGFFSIVLYGWHGYRVKTLLFLTSGISCWFIGEFLFYAYEFILHTRPFPSIADFFYLIAYPLMFFALIYEIQHVTIDWKKIHFATMFLFIIADLALAALVLYFGVYLAYDPHVSLFTNIIAISYGIGDLFLIITTMLVLVLAWEFRGGSFSKVWLFLFASFICTLIGDILFAIFNIQYQAEVWLYKSLIDTIFLAGYVLFANSLFSFGLSILHAQAKLKKSNIQT